MSKIRFLFEPKEFETGAHAIVKADAQGRKRKYLTGISSGIEVDAHGERMTENAINSFMEKANEGHVLLFADTHGIKMTDDIGLLTKANIMDNGDWFTEYRLFDAHDGVGQRCVDDANKLWMQVTGTGPYGGRPLEKGFSIEGTVDDENVIFDSQGRRALDKVDLEGVVVVPRPAYKPSVVNAVSKALGLDAPPSLRNRIQELMRRERDEETYYRKRYQIDDALERVVSEIVANNETDPNEMRDQLAVAFAEYSQLMIDLIVGNSDAIIGDRTETVARDEATERLNLSKAMMTSLDGLAAHIHPGGVR